MESQNRVVVIAECIGGCSALYHLTHEGWTDAVLVERDELTSGTTWHSAAYRQGDCKSSLRPSDDRLIIKRNGAQGRNQPDPRPGSALGTDTRIFSRVIIFSY